MATYNSNVWNTIYGPTDVGGRGIVNIVGSILIPAGTGLATGDVLNFFRCRSGGHLRSIWIQNSDFGTDAPGTLGHYGVDDGVAIDADSIAADVVLETAADRTFENLATAVQTSGTAFQAPFATVTEDFAIKAVIGTMNTPATAGAKYVKFAAELLYFGADLNNANVFTYNTAASGSSVTE